MKKVNNSTMKTTLYNLQTEKYEYDQKQTGITIKTYSKKSVRIIQSNVKSIIQKIQQLVRNFLYYKKKQFFFIIQVIIRDQIKNDYEITHSVEKIKNKYIAYSSFFESKKQQTNEFKITKNEKKNSKIHMLMKHRISEQIKQLIQLSTLIFKLKKKIAVIHTPPVKNIKYTILKSPHVDKKAREQFKKRTNTLHIRTKAGAILTKYIERLLRIIKKETVHSYTYKYSVLQ